MANNEERDDAGEADWRQLAVLRGHNGNGRDGCLCGRAESNGGCWHVVDTSWTFGSHVTRSGTAAGCNV